MKNQYEVRENNVAIFLVYKGETFEMLIDFDDLGKFLEYKGTVNNSRMSGKDYAIVSHKRKLSLVHRWLFKEIPEGLVVDHINRNTLDNRRENLRLVPHMGNMQNRKPRKGSKSGIRGVSWYEPTKRWNVNIYSNGKNIHIGFFKDIKEAEQAAIAARLKYMAYAVEGEGV